MHICTALVACRKCESPSVLAFEMKESLRSLIFTKSFIVHLFLLTYVVVVVVVVGSEVVVVVDVAVVVVVKVAVVLKMFPALFQVRQLSGATTQR